MTENMTTPEHITAAATTGHDLVWLASDRPKTRDQKAWLKQHGFTHDNLTKIPRHLVSETDATTLITAAADHDLTLQQITSQELRDMINEATHIPLTVNQISQDWLDAHGIDEKRNFVYWMCVKGFINECQESYMQAIDHQGKGKRTYTAESIKADLAEHTGHVGARTGFTMLEYYRDAFERVGDRPASVIHAWITDTRRAYGDIA